MKSNKEIWRCIAAGLRVQGSLGSSGTIYDEKTDKYCALGVMNPPAARSGSAYDWFHNGKIMNTKIMRAIYTAHDLCVLKNLDVEGCLKLIAEKLNVPYEPPVADTNTKEEENETPSVESPARGQAAYGGNLLCSV